MADVIEKLETNAVIQHGKLNDRIYLMDAGGCYINRTIEKLNSIAEKNCYGKIFAKVPEWAGNKFEADGYLYEAKIPRFYKGEITGCFMAKFFSEKREKNTDYDRSEQILELAKSKKDNDSPEPLPKSCNLRILNEKDVDKIAALYDKVFKSYPFPINSPDYIRKTMNENFYYFGIFKGKILISVASAETYLIHGNAEMTDFATDPEFLGKNLSFFLLQAMEEDAAKRNIPTFFTIARSLSPGMNITFSKSGYKYAGTLINNTNICGKIENMNVWYKPPQKKKRVRLI
jgi:putative beta-lysine N-acetyltransferase